MPNWVSAVVFTWLHVDQTVKMAWLENGIPEHYKILSLTKCDDDRVRLYKYTCL